MAIGHVEYGGGQGLRVRVQKPGGSMAVINASSATHRGMFNITGLSNGEILASQNPVEANATSLVKGNTYYYRIRGTNSQGTDWADSSAVFVSENDLDVSTGTLVFNTDGPTPSWKSNSGTGGNGQLVNRSYTDASSNTVSYNVAVYNFDSLNIGDGVAVTLKDPIRLKSMSSAMLPSMRFSMPMVLMEKIKRVFAQVFLEADMEAINGMIPDGVLVVVHPT